MMKKSKKIISTVLTVIMLFTVVPGIDLTRVSAFETGLTVEAETGILANSMAAYQSPTAGGGKYIAVTSGARLDDPVSLSQPDARYTFNIATAGSYKVYMRAYAPSTGSDSYWFRWDSASYTLGAATAGSTWGWQETAAVSLTQGSHTLDICHRENGYFIDLIVVTPNLTSAQKADIDAVAGTGYALLEAESGVLGNAMTGYESLTASGGTAISVIDGARLDDPGSLSQPDARYSFTITTAGNYKVYLRAYAPGTGSDSYWFRWDGAAYTQGAATVGSNWTWMEIAATALTTGSHTLDICHRENRFYIDMVVVATNLTAAQKDAIDDSISITSSTAVTYTTVNGSAMFEAESTTLNASLYATTADASASNGNVIIAAASQTSPAPSTSAAGAEFNIIPDRTATYDIWIRYTAVSDGQDSLYYSFNGGNYTSKGLPITGANPSDYKWMKLDSITTPLYIGAKYNFKLHPREMGARIDKIIVTAYPFYAPSGAVTNLDSIAYTYQLPSAYPMPTVTPPSAHPRVGFRSSHINDIKADMQKSQNANALTAYNNYLAQNTDGILGTVIISGTNYNAAVLANIEAYALKYALDGDATYGNKAVTAIKNYLNTVILDDGAQDVTRPMGHVIFVSSEVYDWCYPLLTAADKNNIIAACEAIAKRMEVGYPPSGQGAVTGHGGELQLFRDLLSFGIAAYNERPDIYNYVAGRLLSQFIEPRNYWYPSGTHHQGDSYGQFRYTCESIFQWIMYRMSGLEMFSATSEFVPYQWIYTRRPDGQSFRNGDDYQETGSAVGTYWTNDRNANFYSSNFHGNGFIKQQFIAEAPDFNTFDLNCGLLTPVNFLLFNDPDLAGQSHTSSFPLTKYFGSPYGMMIARTGWTEPGAVNLSSNVAMAQMVIGEQWAANHQHLDAGSFQLYYKGALAGESGVYDSYNTNHDKNYNKETIAHNSLLVYDPNETMYGGIVNSGGQRRPGGEVNTFSAWMSAGYDRGEVLDQAYDTGSALPAYSYIKGDITRAYTSKVSEAVRSMMFMPLTDGSHPAALIVMDRVTAVNPAFTKTWLLHSQQEPAISGSTAVIDRNTDGYNGRLNLTTLLPSGAALSKVGGAGHEFDINGTNYPPTGTFGTACEKGAWRIQVRPSSANATDYFLNVMQVSDASANAAPLTATLIETADVAGAKLYDRVAIFGKSRNRITNNIAFTVPGSETGGLKITVAGVAEGSWNVYRNSTLLCTATATADGGIIYFEGGAGSYSLSRPGTVSNILYRSSLGGSPVTNASLSIINGNSGVAPVNNGGVIQDNVGEYRSADMAYRIYGDRDPSGAGGDGSSSSYPIYGPMGMLYTTTTSSLFRGTDTTKLLTLNNAKTISESIPNLYSFTISKGATVYIAGPVNSTYIPTQGWTKDNTGLKAARGTVSTVLNAADNKYYAVPSGDSQYAHVYYKHYEAGATVSIPSPGAASSSGCVVLMI